MNVLVTGGTGFLGKFVVQGLLNDPKINKIYLTSRQPISFPDSKVESVIVDLSRPIPDNLIDINSIQTVIHLAGEYNFEGNYDRSYLGNVLATRHLLDFLETADHKINLLYASTYGILPEGADSEMSELPLPELPSKENHYAYTKAIAEDMVLNSGLNGVCFRIGVIVGDSEKGLISKIDGPYYFVRMAEKINKIPLMNKSLFFILPGKYKAIVPIIAVDEAARPFVEAVGREFNTMHICGLYNQDSVKVGEMAEVIFKVYLPYAKLIFTEYPKAVIERQEALTGVPADAIFYLSAIKSLSNDNFLKLFPNLEPTHFLEMKKILFDGYKKYNEGIVT